MDTVTRVFGVVPPKVTKSTLHPVRCAHPELVCGVELEIENCSENAETYLAQIGQKLWKMDRDGSLRPPERSWEFISKPIQLQHLLPELERFFNLTKFGDANYSDRCSVHMHCNVTDFTQKQLATLALVYVIFEDVLFKFVNHHKAPTADGYCRDTNIYCIPWNQCRMNFNLVNKIFAQPADAFRQWQKYTALNLIPITTQGTVEWRHMHGTHDMEKLTQWFNLIGAIMKFCQDSAFEDVVETVKVLNDNSAYHQFFDLVLKGYLPFEEQYQPAMAEGIINAKYSLISWEQFKGKPDTSEMVFLNLDIEAQEEPIRIRRERIVAEGREERDRQLRAAMQVEQQAFIQEAMVNRFMPPPPPAAWGMRNWEWVGVGDRNIAIQPAAPEPQDAPMEIFDDWLEDEHEEERE